MNKVNNCVTDNIVHDRMINLEYKPLTKKEEVKIIKRLKLSYYDTATEEEKKLYLNYYFEEFPEFKEKFENSLEQKKLLESAIENAYEYRDYFLQNNTRLVFSVVKEFTYINYNFEDVFQEAMIGMMRALEKFEIEQENKFSSYAIWWIKQSIIRYFQQKNNTIRPSYRLSEGIYKYNKSKENLQKQLGREPSKEELIKNTGISKEKLERIITFEQNLIPLSLNEPVKKNSYTTLGDVIKSDINFTEEIDNKLSNIVLFEEIKKLNLNPIEQKIIAMRYGFNNENVHTYDDIAKKINLPKDKIRSIDKKFLYNLRKNKRILGLNDNIRTNKKIH